MLTWFKERAPIRKKMAVIFGFECCFVAAAGAAFVLSNSGLISSLSAYCLAGGALAGSALMGLVLSPAVSGPYVATVLRIEGIVAGDLESPILFTGHGDCVGRMARAMVSYKNSAIAIRAAEKVAVDNRAREDQDRKTDEAGKARHSADIEQAFSTIAKGLAQLAEGNLLYSIDTPLVGDADRLRIDFNDSVNKLQQTMLAVGTNANGIRSGSMELSGATDDLARRTEKQAASLEETAAALDSIMVTVKKTAEGAIHARQVVTTAKDDAEASGAIAQDAVEAMKGIASSSRQIGQIIGVIDEIAFQTNLLALNAGVEAARAGEAGRGFAVVASEVRALAQRSAEAAKEIKALISNSTTHVDQGVELVTETGKALSRIVSHVTEINNVVMAIAGSAQEQSIGLQEVNTAVTQMDQMTQQNAAMVEESTAASHTVMKEAESLSQLLARFKVGDFGRIAARSAPVAAAKSAARPSAPRAPSYGGTSQAAVARKPQPAAAEEGWEEF